MENNKEILLTDLLECLAAIKFLEESPVLIKYQIPKWEILGELDYTASQIMKELKNGRQDRNVSESLC